MKIEKKSKTVRREKKQRKSRLVKRVKTKANLKHYTQVETENPIELNNIDTNNNGNSQINEAVSNSFINIIKSSKSLATKIVVSTALLITVVVVSANITPILNYALQDQDSALYPMLKKYANDLRGISSNLMVVTRRLNMLSIISEENEITNTTRINSLVLQINEMWFTTRKYLNFIGIETIAHTDLEREIDANSKVNDKGLIRETATKESIPKKEMTLSNVLKLDSIIQDLNIQINSVNNEINFLEDNAYAAIKASNVYSHLLERSRNENGNYYATRTSPSYNTNYLTNNNSTVITANKKIILSKQIAVETKIPAEIKLVPVNKKVAKPGKKITTKKIKTVKKAKIKQPAKLQSNQTEKIVVVKVPRQKIIGSFTIKDKSNKLSKKQETINEEEIVEEKETLFETPSFLDNVITDFAINFNDYEESDESDDDIQKANVIEEDDYSGG